jgi:D-arabinose 1-dehydrogenase-like Zn-dependent alcohol dehydrogenase
MTTGSAAANDVLATASHAGTAIAMSVAEPGGRLVPRAVELTPPRLGHVRVTVLASGVCHADIGTAAAPKASAEAPVTPGHEVAGVIAELGEGVEGWTVGDRVAVGWFGGSCGHCTPCRTGDVVHCPQRQVPGVSYPGGWAETITVPASALASIPDGLDFADAAPMGCAGVTTFNAIRHAHLHPGATVAVFGLGGLGHLAVQFAAAMGHRTIAIARGPERAELARELGAHAYVDSAERPAGATLADVGGADLIVATAPNTQPAGDLLTGLRVGGRLTLIGIDGGTIAVDAAQLVMNTQTLTGHLTGSAHDTEAAMQFALTTGVRPMIEEMPLTQANEAVARLRAGAPRFRIVLHPEARP